MDKAPTRTSWVRYWPFAVLMLLQLVVVDRQAPTSSVATDGSAGGGVVTAGGAGVGVVDDAAGGGGVGDVGSGGAVATGGGGASSSGGATVGGGRGVGGASASSSAGAGGVAADGAAASAGDGRQPVDQLGRPVDGDRSKCAKDGRQEDVSLQSPPCTPKLAGGNPGPTYQGVTAETIKVVIVYREFEQGVQQARAAAGTTMSPSQAEEAHDVIAEFINQRYELYGRKIDVVEHFAVMPDEAAIRAEAKAVNEKHRPFAVLWYVQPGMPAAFAEQLSRMGVLAIGPNPLGDEFFVTKSPFVWTATVQGSRLADMVADFYCKRMHGKNATLAGDPALRVKARKLAVVSSEDPDALVVAKRLHSQVTGGQCGGGADATVYTYSAVPEEAENQRSALVTRIRSDGNTTVFGGIFAGQEMDRQGYLPEHLLGEVVDDDLVGRIFVALSSAVQMENSVGVGFWSEARPNREQEFWQVMRSVRPDYDAPYPARGPYDGLMFVARLIQQAGPHLTPANVLAGARSAPQIAGWENPSPWPGWKCCNPYAPMYHTALDDKTFGAKADARQIYWDNQAISKQDGVAGAYVSPDNGRRYRVGGWTKGEPRQP